jgi:hypothetical protein
LKKKQRKKKTNRKTKKIMDLTCIRNEIENITTIDELKYKNELESMLNDWQNLDNNELNFFSFTSKFVNLLSKIIKLDYMKNYIMIKEKMIKNNNEYKFISSTEIATQVEQNSIVVFFRIIIGDDPQFNLTEYLNNDLILKDKIDDKIDDIVLNHKEIIDTIRFSVYSKEKNRKSNFAIIQLTSEIKFNKELLSLFDPTTSSIFDQNGFE